ncbi:hypothetical protein MHO82_13210 [Vibrio sp. Of7-15]|uniref:hypothetical protein n=1 Tax=Vibrio sp. Of7-15 TaxID=2724879 RepID=UPI001EF3AAD7|nr:hypothetical protein [Vibrio sp. Of7-15]MCG7497823.1 hypothetical protein [Vibrio sp. Of7-15]
MYDFLVRDFSSDSGYMKKTSLNGALPRSQEESYVPWGMTLDSQVVYAKTGEHVGFNAGRGKYRLKSYDNNVSQERRAEAQSVLGVLALNTPEYTAQAVDKVSAGVKLYLQSHRRNDSDNVAELVKAQIGHYFFTGGRMGFGRISEDKAKEMSADVIWDKLMLALDQGALEQKLAIHDAVGRKILPKLKGPEERKYDVLANSVRETWFDDKRYRGRRAKAGGPAQANAIGGIMSASSQNVVDAVSQSRNRGVDMFERDPNREAHATADDFYDDADVRNLLFGAGISGTTGTLLQAACAFGGLHTWSSELAKQYMLAVVGYLIGGGMHSFHESMVIAQKAGIVNYNPGSYVEVLPTSFLHSAQGKAWAAKYYDISILGAIHWRYNSGTLPSHIQRSLVSD